MTALIIIFGFIFLLLGAEGLVDGASGVAKRLGISNLVIGMTVVAFGTSMPEFVVNMLSVAEGQTDLALTNIVGSNIINIFVILGLTALVYPIASARSARVFDIPMNILAGVVVLVAVLVTLPFESVPGMSRMSGGFFLLIFGIFMYHSVKTAKAEPDSTEDFKPMPLAKALVYIVLGLAGSNGIGCAGRYHRADHRSARNFSARTGYFGCRRHQTQLRPGIGKYRRQRVIQCVLYLRHIRAA